MAKPKFKKDIVQLKNPRTGRYVKIDRADGRILGHKKSKGPYTGVPVARKPAVKVAEMRAEYDFSNGVRGKYTDRIAKGATLVTLDPDIAKAFPTSAAVNRALRAILDVVPKAASRRVRPKKPG